MSTPSPEERAKALVSRSPFSWILEGLDRTYDGEGNIVDVGAWLQHDAAAAIREAVEAERARCEAKVRAGLLFAKGEAERELNAGDGGNFQRWGFAASRLEVVLEDIRSRSEKP